MTSFAELSGSAFSIAAGRGGINQGDLVEISADFLGYTAKYTDYAKTPNKGTLGTLTTVNGLGGAGTSTQDTNQAPFVIKGSDGYLYALSNISGTTGLQISKMDTGYHVLKTLQVESTGSSCYVGALVQMDNGNFGVTYVNYTTVYRQAFAVVSADLSTLTAHTLPDSENCFASTNPVIMPKVAAIPSTGFAVFYGTNPSASYINFKLALFDYNGGTILAPTTLQQINGNSGVASQLIATPDGNVTAMWTMNYSGAINQYAVYSKTGAVVQAAGQLPGTTSGSPGTWGMFFALHNIGNVLCAAYEDSTGYSYHVMSSAGAAIGSAYRPTLGTQQSSYQTVTDITDDGTNFVLVYPSSTSSYVALDKLSTAAAVVRTVVTSLACQGVTGTTTVGNTVATCDPSSGYVIVVGSLLGSNASEVQVFDGNTGATILTTTALGVNGLSSPKVYLMGDFTALVYGTTGSASLISLKFQDASILGWALSSAAQGGKVAVAPSRAQGGSLFAAVNSLIGSSGVTFDHTTGANIYGNKGTLYLNGAILKGM